MQSKFCSIVVLFLGACYCESTTSQSSTEAYRYITYRDGNTTHVIDLQAAIDSKLLARETLPDNEYLLFTQRNMYTPQYLYTKNASSISSSNFNAAVPTVVIAHGWWASSSDPINPSITKAYLAKSDVNIIVLDWSWLAMLDYVTASFGVPSAGRSLGKFLTFLNTQTGAKYSDMHLIGFSLGAHVVGNAGRSLNTKVARITGLDPAGPLWSHNNERLQKTDAVYVEAIHTDRRLLGTSLNDGDTNFSPNGGFTQPGCKDDNCSHQCSWQYFAATVTYNNLIGHNCGTDLGVALNLCFGNTLPMGNDDLRKTGSGIYRVKVTSNFPYS